MTPIIKVSVVVPCFNYGHLLSETLESVRRQSLNDWECIVVDDGSTDNTGEVGHSYASRDRRFSLVRQDNSGLSAARNTGMHAAKGEYVQLLDADDLLEDDKLRVHAAFLDENERYSLVYGPMLFFRDRAASRKTSRVSMITSLGSNDAIGLPGTSPNASTTAMLLAVTGPVLVIV